MGLSVQRNGESGKEVTRRVQAGWSDGEKCLESAVDSSSSIDHEQETELGMAELKMERFSWGVWKADEDG